MTDLNKSASNVNWSENGQPISRHYGDMYFSIANGLAETQYVFIEQNHLTERFKSLTQGEHFIIGETGFGTGLNFLHTWKHWLNCAPKETYCHFISTEKFPLRVEELTRSLALWPSLAPLATRFLKVYQQQLTGHNEPHYYTFKFNSFTLTLIVDDVCKGLRQLLPQQHIDFNQPQWQGVDAWYLDGFSPVKNPEMWSSELIQLVHRLSKPTATIATYTAATSVKKTLESNGFLIKKQPGFGKKREMITATLDPAYKRPAFKSTTKNQTPWAYASSNSINIEEKQKTIAVIGAGLAGCHTARALAKQGFAVTVFEANPSIANEASGNPQAMLYAKLSANNSSLTEFNLSALLKAQTLYTDFWQQCDMASEGRQCGLLQLAKDDQSHQKQMALWQRYQYSDFLKKTTADESARIANIAIDAPGLFFPYSGWINPKALCEWLLNHPRITLHTDTCVDAINTIENNQWQLNLKHDDLAQHRFSHVIICNAHAAKQFTPTMWLPTKALRGQISYLESQAPLNQLQTVVTGENYIAPAVNKEGITFNTIGASYDLKHTHKNITTHEHQQNVGQLNTLLSVTLQTPHITGGRANLRCTSPDYLPLVGQVPHKNAFLDNYQALSFNAKQAIEVAGEYLPGLFLNCGHGSRGLAYTPLAAEVIAAQITATPPPVSQNLIEALAPARFLIREIKKMPHH